MSRLLTLRQAVIDQVKAALPNGWDVEAHLGRFDAAAIKQFILKAPAVRVAILALEKGRTLDGDAVEVTVRLGLYVVTRDQGARLARETTGAAAVETITLLAIGQRWGLPFAKPAAPASAQVIHSAETLAAGLALWAVDLPQTIWLERPEGKAYPIHELYVGIAPEIGAAHEADYLGPLVADQPAPLTVGGEDV